MMWDPYICFVVGNEYENDGFIVNDEDEEEEEEEDEERKDSDEERQKKKKKRKKKWIFYILTHSLRFYPFLTYEKLNVSVDMHDTFEEMFP